MSKIYNSNVELQQQIKRGIDTLADNVASTLGPKGRNVILKLKDKSPIITKDGVTVAKFIELDDPFENLGAQIVKQVSLQTNTDAGDGTTTATVLARAMFDKAVSVSISDISPVEIKKGMDKAVEAIVRNIISFSQPIRSKEDIAHIATISANGDTTIGELIATAVDQIGKDGSITVEEARSSETSLDIIEGFRFDAGYVAKQFITNERKSSARYDEPFILVTDYKLDAVEEIIPVLEIVARDGRPLIIVADEIEGQALAAFIMNAIRGTMKIVAVKAPKYGEERREILKDLALSVGATFVTRNSGLAIRNVELKHLGTAKTVEVLKNSTTIIGGKANYEKIDERIEGLKSELVQTENLSECERIQERITRLASGVAIIKVGAPTEIEMIEKKHRVEDALEAVRSAQVEGIVPGGGSALIKASRNLELELDNREQQIGVDIVCTAAHAPFRQIMLNAGKSPELLLETLKESEENIGFDVVKNEMVDMFEGGVVDPTKVVRCALQNAASVISTLITTNYAIVQI